MLSVQLLGGIAVERDGVLVPLSSLHLRLLAFLALHPGPHNRDALAARFWPDSPHPRASLRTAVWTLRQSLGPDAVVASRVAVALGPVVRDLDDPDRDGQLCPGLEDDWAETARAAHLGHRTDCFDALIAAADDPATAVALAARRCALTPLDEPAHRTLIERLAAAGDRAGALLAGRTLAARLRAELGVDLAPATTALLATLRAPASAPDHATGQRRPLFGRTRELTALTAAWTATRDGHGGRVVVITGEAGIGKTRLVAELARRARDGGARVAIGAGIDVGGEAPLAVWQELAAALVAVVPPPPAAAAWPVELGRLAPELAVALGVHTRAPTVAAPELERLRLFDAVLRLVEWAARRPVLLVAEDTHRADRASLALCAHIGRRLANLPVLFVLTRRDRPARSDADALLVDLAGRGLDVTEIELGPLQPGEVAEVARSVAALPYSLLDQVVALADGNPLLAVESARALAAGRTAPPPSLRALVRAALGTLPDSARKLAEAVAVTGRPLSATEIGALAAEPEAERRVVDTGLVHREPGGLCYRHALLAEAVRADLPDPHGVHLAVALAVESAAAGRKAGERAAEVGRHLQTAGRDDLAAPRWKRAARHARSLGALPEAAAFWHEAARADPDDADAWLELAETHAWLGHTAKFDHAWETALDRLPSSELPAAWCRRGLWFKTVACNPPASLAAYRRAQDLLPADAPAELRTQVLVGLGWNEASAGDPARAELALAAAAALRHRARPGSRGRTRDRTVDRRDAAQPVRRMRSDRVPGRDHHRPPPAAGPRLRRLDHDRLRAGVLGRPRRRAALRRPRHRRHLRHPGGHPALPGRSRTPAVAHGPPPGGIGRCRGTDRHGRASRLHRLARRRPLRRRARRAGRGPRPRRGRPDRPGARRRRGRQPTGRPARAGRSAGRRRRSRRGDRRAAPRRPRAGEPGRPALDPRSPDGAGAGPHRPGRRRPCHRAPTIRRGGRRLAQAHRPQPRRR